MIYSVNRKYWKKNLPSQFVYHSQMNCFGIKPGTPMWEAGY
jgi:hypothetical protein